MQTSPAGCPNGEQTKVGFTLIELLAVIFIIGILVALLSAAVTRGLAAAQSAKCVANLRQLGVAANQYSMDNNSKLIPMFVRNADGLASSRVWRGLLRPYLGNDVNALICPADEFELNRLVNAATARVGLQPTSYGMNNTFYDDINGVSLPKPGYHDYDSLTPGRRLVSVIDPASTIFLSDSGTPDDVGAPLTSWTETRRRTSQASFGYAKMPNQWTSGDFSIYPRHGNGTANVLYYDGHVGSVYIQEDLVEHPIGDPRCLYD